MSDTNRDYYKRMYDKIHASEELQERLINMKKNNVTQYQFGQETKQEQKKAVRPAWKVAAAAVALSVIIPTGVYAASHYFGISDFFLQSGHKLTADADKLIEKDIPQTTEKDTSEKMPVTFTVQEALCDSGSVSIVIEAKAKESGKYLLVPGDALETDPLENIGVTGQGTIGEYAEKKNLEILHVSTGFQADSPFCPDGCSYITKALNDDTMSICVTADRTKDTDLNAVMIYAVREAGSDDVMQSTTSFELQDGSSSEVVLYAVSGGMEVPGTQAVITKVAMEKTEVSIYVTVYYTDPQGDTDENGLTFRMKDKTGENIWNKDRGGSGVVSLGNGSYSQRIVYDVLDFPEECTLEAFNCWEKNIYGQFELTRIKS